MAGNGFSGLYSQDKVHCPKYTRFNLQGHIFLLQGHIKKCVKNTLILMPDERPLLRPQENMPCISGDQILCFNHAD
jgi:hypothetical protein